MAKHFIVTNKEGQKRLIEAANKAAALSHVVGSEYQCEPAKTADVVALFANGVALEVVPEGAKRKKQGEASSPQQAQQEAETTETDSETEGIF